MPVSIEQAPITKPQHTITTRIHKNWTQNKTAKQKQHQENIKEMTVQQSRTMVRMISGWENVSNQCKVSFDVESVVSENVDKLAHPQHQIMLKREVHEDDAFVVKAAGLKKTWSLPWGMVNRLYILYRDAYLCIMSPLSIINLQHIIYENDCSAKNEIRKLKACSQN